jgi:hypothetical protein
LPDRFQHDVLVIGSGIAGLFYALRVADRATVAVVTKKSAADSATNWAQGGIAAVLDPEDTAESHIQDTLTAGDGLCHEDVVRRVVERGPAMIDALLKLGADFDAREAPGAESARAFDLGREGGHSHRRILHHRDATGREIERVLLARARAHPNPDPTASSAPTSSTPTPGASPASKPGSRCSPPAERARSISTRATPTSPPATAWRWPIGPGRRWRTWSSCSSTRPVSSTRRRSPS